MAKLPILAHVVMVICLVRLRKICDTTKRKTENCLVHLRSSGDGLGSGYSRGIVSDSNRGHDGNWRVAAAG